MICEETEADLCCVKITLVLAVEMLVGGERLEAGRLINWELWLSRQWREAHLEDDDTLQGLQEEFKSRAMVPAFLLPASPLAPPLLAPSPQTTQEDEDLSSSGLHLPLTSAPPCSGQCME